MARENVPASKPIETKRTAHRQETQARWERLWLKEGEQWNPLRSALEQARLKRAQEFLLERGGVAGKTVVDLGSGWGTLSRWAAENGAKVTAVDAAENALTRLPDEIQACQDVLPQTRLEDDSYDLVIATEILAELPQRDHRLFISELYRLCKPEGRIVLSTAVDFESWDALSRLEKLLQTDLTIESWQFSHHAYFHRLLNLLLLPERLWTKEGGGRSRIGRLAWGLARLPVIRQLWRVLSPLTNRLHTLASTSLTLALTLEKIAKTVSKERGVSDILLIAKRKRLFEEEESSRWKKKAGDCLKA